MRRTLDLHDVVPALTTLMRADDTGSLSTSELRSVLAHRDSVLDHLAVTLRAGARLRRRTAGDVTVTELARHPVEALLGSLRTYPRTGERVDVAPTERFSRRPVNPVEASWRDLHRVLLIAAHDWHTAADAPPPGVQWGLVADVAAIGLSITRLDADLLGAALHHRLGPASAALIAAHRSPLRLAARDARDLAVSGSTTHRWRPPPAPDRRVIVMQGLHQMAEGSEQLARMLHDTRVELTAVDALTILNAHAHECMVLGAVLTRAEHNTEQADGTGQLLESHGRLLVEAARTAHGRLNSFIAPRHRHVINQAHEIHRCMASNVSVKWPPHELAIEAAQAFAARARAITAGITGVLAHGVCCSRQWVTIDTDALDVRWRLTTHYDMERMFDKLHQAGGLAAPLGPKTPSSLLPELGDGGAPLEVNIGAGAGAYHHARPELPRLDAALPPAPVPMSSVPGPAL
jgi:hypothetical protein